MKYYLHDSNAFNDEKITELFMNFGYEGLGLFYTLLEKLANQEKPVKTEVLKTQLKVGKKLNKCWDFMESIGLISSNNGDTFNKQLLNFSEKYQIKKEKNAKRISEWRENQTIKENVTNYEQVCNTPKDNIIKDKIIKVNIKEEDFADKSAFPLCVKVYFDFYENHTGIKPKFDKLQGSALKTIISYIKTISTNGTEPQTIADNLKIIFDNHQKWDGKTNDQFLRKQLKLTQINSNLVNIINNIKNGHKNPNAEAYAKFSMFD